MNITFNLEPREIRTANWLLVRHLLLPIGLAIGGLLLIAGLLCYFGIVQAAIILLGTIALIALMLTRFVLLSSASIKAGYDNLGMATYALDEDGIRISYSNGQVFIPWKSLARWDQDKNIAVLKQLNRSILIFPERAFTPDQWKWLIDSLRNMLPI